MNFSDRQDRAQKPDASLVAPGRRCAWIPRGYFSSL